MLAPPLFILSLKLPIMSYLELMKEYRTVKTVIPIPNIVIANDSILAICIVDKIQLTNSCK